MAKVLLRISVALASLIAGVAVALAQATAGEPEVARLIVKFRDNGQRAALALSDRVARVAAAEGVTLSHRRSMALGAHLLALDRPLPLRDANALAARLARQADIEFVQVDRRRRPLLVPNDTYVGGQTYLQNSVGGIDAVAAWETTTGSPNTIVAVVDSGYRPHADLAGRILPGYDFISDPKVANDGDGRDADATDPGDWINAADLSDPDFTDCAAGDSSWHGTSIAGIVAANANNAQWLAGIDWAAKILPVRVLGKCGGYDSDILDGVAWAAGLAVPGVPANPYPAQVINLSIGGPGPCEAGYQSVIDAVLAHGVTRAIVVAAGNDGGDVANEAPANCAQVIAVAATTKSGFRAGYSNFGAGITLSAPGGASTPLVTDAIYVLSNAGATTPGADNINVEIGTSFSAPIVAGVVSLMLGVAPGLTAAQVRSILVSAAKPFPAGSTCNTSICGAGIVAADAAVNAAIAAAGGGRAFNVQGLWWVAGGTESYWGINVADWGNQVFATWYTYDVNGNSWWLSMLAKPTAGNTFTGDINVDDGPPFDNFVGIGKPAGVGTGTLTFTDANNGTFTYDLNAGTGGSAIRVSQPPKPIARYDLGSGPQPTCAYDPGADAALATNYQDLWWEASGAQSGWGINFAHQGDQIFATWYTYDASRAPLWLSALLRRSGNSYTGDLLRTSGPRFDAYRASDVVQPIPKVGTATLTIANGNSATFAYSTDGSGGLPVVINQQKSIVRYRVAAGGTVCH